MNGWSIAGGGIRPRGSRICCAKPLRGCGIDVAKQGMTNPFTQQQIADITGQTSVNVNRVFADLERQGLIERHGPRNHVPRLAGNAPRRELPAGYLE